LRAARPATHDPDIHPDRTETGRQRMTVPTHPAPRAVVVPAIVRRASATPRSWRAGAHGTAWGTVRIGSRAAAAARPGRRIVRDFAVRVHVGHEPAARPRPRPSAGVDR